MRKILLSLLMVFATAITVCADTFDIDFTQLGLATGTAISDIPTNSLPITIVGNKSDSSTTPTYYQNPKKPAEWGWRIYGKGELTISAKEGYTIREITFTAPGTDSEYAFSATAKDEEGNALETVSVNGITSTWKGETNSITFKVTNSRHCRITKMSVTYELSAQGPINPTYGNYKEEYSLIIGEEMAFPAISPKELTYKFTTEDSDIIEIDETNKTFKALKDGIAVISFSTEAFEDKFNAGSGEFMIEVTKKTPKLSFHDQIVYGKLNVGVVWQELLIEDPTDADRSTISYSSSDPTIVVVDPVTGQIKPEDIKRTGEVIITATLPSAGDYAEGSESYKILVLDPEAQIEPSTVVFDFSVENPYGMTTQTSGSTYETKIKEIEGDDVVTVSFDGNYRSWSASGGYQLRIHKNASFTVEVPDGYKITQIGMVADKEGKNMTGEFNPGGSVEEVEGDHAGEWEEVNFHWHAGDKVVGKVTYTNPGAGANDNRDNNDIITKLFVMYEAASSDLKSAKLSFTPTVNGIIAGEEATINAVKNPNGREVRYALANVENTEEETLYTIEPTADGKQLKVWVKNPGYYTIEARSDAGDGFRDGFAIMRLNVFNHLDVFVDDVKIEEDVIATSGEESKVVTFEVVQPEVLKIYYRIEDKNTPAIDPDEETGDENCLPGYELYDDMIEIPANTNGKLLFYVANYGYKSPIRTIVLGKEETEFTAPALLGLDGEGVKIEGEDATGYMVESDHVLSLTFDIDEDGSVVVVYFLGTEDDEEVEPQMYEGEPIQITKSCLFSYYAVDMTSGSNFMDMKRTDPINYMFTLTLPVVAPEAPEFEVVGGNKDGNYINSSEVVTIKFKPVDGIHVYYKAALKNEPAKARDCNNENGHGDFTKHDGVEEIELNNTHASFSVFACNPETGAHSDTVTYTLDVATGVSEIEAADSADTLYFDLQGVRVVNPDKGTYIRVTKGKAEKVVK